MDCEHGSLVKICGLRRIKFYDAHTSVDHTRCQRGNYCLAGHSRCYQLEQGRCWVGRVQIKQLQWRLMWPLWLWHEIKARAVMLLACVAWCGGALSLTGRIFRAFHEASNDHPWDNYHRFALILNGWYLGLCAFVQLLLWTQFLPVSNARVQVTCVHARYCPTSITARLRNEKRTSVGVWSPLLGLLSYSFPFRNTRLAMYWGSIREQGYSKTYQSPKQTFRSCRRRGNYEKMAGGSTHSSAMRVCTHTSAPR